MMTAQCLHVPMVGHYHQAIIIKSFSEVYNSHKSWILQIHVYFQSVISKQKRDARRHAKKRRGGPVVLGVQSWTEKKIRALV